MLLNKRKEWNIKPGTIYTKFFKQIFSKGFGWLFQTDVMWNEYHDTTELYKSTPEGDGLSDYPIF